MMNTLAAHLHHAEVHPLDVDVQPALEGRDRLTVFFRFLLAIPHLLLVGAPVAGILTWGWTTENGFEFGPATGGALGAVAGVCAIIAWFAIVFGARYPEGLRGLVMLYLRWRVRAVAYIALLRDEYPPFGEGRYPATLEAGPVREHRDRLSVAFRLVLAIPHIISVWVLGVAWAFSTLIAWFAILFTGRYPETLYHFGVGVFRWNIRLEAYLLLLHDEYPPFSLDGNP